MVDSLPPVDGFCGNQRRLSISSERFVTVVVVVEDYLAGDRRGDMPAAIR